MKKHIFYIFFLFFIAPVFLHAQELTWQDCVNEAIKNNLEILSAKAKLEQAKANAWVAKSSVFPQISASASASKSGSEPAPGSTNEIGAGTTYSSNYYSESYSYGISARQILFDGLKSLNDINKSNKELEIAEINYKRTSASLRYKLRQSFINLMKAQELIKITEDILQRRKKQYMDIRLRYEAGKEHKGSLLNSSASLSQAEFENEQAKRNLSLVQQSLANAIGRENFEEIKVNSDFVLTINLNQEPDFEQILLKNYDYILLDLTKKSAECSYASSIGSFFPSVSLNGSISRSGEKFLPEDTGWSLGINISLPILDGGLLIAKVRSAGANLQQAEKDFEYGRKDILLNIKQAWNSLLDAKNNCEIQDKFLEAANERAKIADVQYSNGLLNFDNWIIIQDNLVNTKKSYINAEANLLITEDAWIQIKGGTLEDEKQ